MRDVIDKGLDLLQLATYKETEEAKLRQKQIENENFVKSSEQQTQLINKQLEILDNQTRIFNQTKNIYWLILLATVVSAIGTIIQALK